MTRAAIRKLRRSHRREWRLIALPPGRQSDAEGASRRVIRVVVSPLGVQRYIEDFVSFTQALCGGGFQLGPEHAVVFQLVFAWRKVAHCSRVRIWHLPPSNNEGRFIELAFNA